MLQITEDIALRSSRILYIFVLRTRTPTMHVWDELSSRLVQVVNFAGLMQLVNKSQQACQFH